MKIFNPNTSTDEWKLLSKRENLMIDAEDSQTQLFRMDHRAKAEDLELDATTLR